MDANLGSNPQSLGSDNKKNTVTPTIIWWQVIHQYPEKNTNKKLCVGSSYGCKYQSTETGVMHPKTNSTELCAPDTK